MASQFELPSLNKELVTYFGKTFLTVAPELLTCEQKLVVAGCFEEGKALSIVPSGVQECSLLTSDAEESDTRVWFHVVHSLGTKKQLFSPDTDVYHIDLPLLNHCVYDVYVHHSPIISPEVRLLHLNQLQLAFAGDPDLALIPLGLRTCVVQTLFICSDVIMCPFLLGLGKPK